MLAGIDAIGGFVQDGSAGSFWLDISDTEVSKTSGSFSPETLTTFPVTVTPHGGSGATTYAWTRISGSTDIDPDAPTSAATTFSATLNPGQAVTAVFVCTATNGSGAVATSDPVSVRISLVDIS